MNEMNIFQRMAKITSELPVVAKNLKVETCKGKGYKAVSERDVLDAVKPLEEKFGIFSFPFSRELMSQEILNVGNAENSKTVFMSRMKTVYRFVNIDNPDEYIDTTVFSEGIDSQDKGSGKSMTYGDKYALMKIYKISTGDDPDAEPSLDCKYEKVSDPEFEKAVARSLLIDTLKKMGIDVAEYSKVKGLNKNATKEQFEKCLKELENEGKD